MTIDFTAEQQAFAQAVAAFCRKECGTREQRDALTGRGEHNHNQDLYLKMADLGWLGITVPEEYGGSAGTAVDMCILLEQAARGMAPIGGVGPTLITGAAYAKFGTDAQKETVLGGIVRGASESISMSEPEAGSDVGNLSCKAEKVSGGWLINGQKTWCSNAHFAENILLVARTDRTGSKHEGLTMFHLPADTPGLKISGIATMGGKEVNDLYLTDVLLPRTRWSARWDRDGRTDDRPQHRTPDPGRHDARHGQRAFDDALEFVTQRKQFRTAGRNLPGAAAPYRRPRDRDRVHPATVYNTARLVDDNPTKMFPREASMVKLKATETAKKVALEGMQMMGGYGYATEFDMEGHVRKTLVASIYGGTNEIQRDIIGKTYGL